MNWIYKFIAENSHEIYCWSMALLIDGLDGSLARKIGVTDKTPNIDGSALDLVIDNLNYVIIPALMIYWFQFVPPGWEVYIPAGIFAVSLYTFANINKKTSDYYFSGFPAVWNIVVLYFYILGTTSKASPTNCGPSEHSGNHDCSSQ